MCLWKQWLQPWLVQLTGRCHPAKRKVTGSIPGQGTCVGYRFSPLLGYVQEATIDVSLSLPFSLPSPL